MHSGQLVQLIDNVISKSHHPGDIARIFPLLEHRTTMFYFNINCKNQSQDDVVILSDKNDGFARTTFIYNGTKLL